MRSRKRCEIGLADLLNRRNRPRCGAEIREGVNHTHKDASFLSQKRLRPGRGKLATRKTGLGGDRYFPHNPPDRGGIFGLPVAPGGIAVDTGFGDPREFSPLLLPGRLQIDNHHHFFRVDKGTEEEASPLSDDLAANFGIPKVGSPIPALDLADRIQNQSADWKPGVVSPMLRHVRAPHLPTDPV